MSTESLALSEVEWAETSLTISGKGRKVSRMTLSAWFRAGFCPIRRSAEREHCVDGTRTFDPDSFAAAGDGGVQIGKITVKK